MRSTHLHFRRREHYTTEFIDRVNYICVAADLLDQMFFELRSLAMNNPEFAGLLSDSESDARVGLWTLNEIVALLLRGDNPSIAEDLIHQATALISWLSANLDELTLCALRDGYPVDSIPPRLH